MSIWYTGVGTAGTMWALAPEMLNLRGRKYRNIFSSPKYFLTLDAYFQLVTAV